MALVQRRRRHSATTAADPATGRNIRRRLLPPDGGTGIVSSMDAYSQLASQAASCGGGLLAGTAGAPGAAPAAAAATAAAQDDGVPMAASQTVARSLSQIGSQPEGGSAAASQPPIMMRQASRSQLPTITGSPDPQLGTASQPPEPELHTSGGGSQQQGEASDGASPLPDCGAVPEAAEAATRLAAPQPATTHAGASPQPAAGHGFQRVGRRASGARCPSASQVAEFLDSPPPAPRLDGNESDSYNSDVTMPLAPAQPRLPTQSPPPAQSPAPPQSPPPAERSQQPSQSRSHSDLQQPSQSQNGSHSHSRSQQRSQGRSQQRGGADAAAGGSQRAGGMAQRVVGATFGWASGAPQRHPVAEEPSIAALAESYNEVCPCEYFLPVHVCQTRHRLPVAGIDMSIVLQSYACLKVCAPPSCRPQRRWQRLQPTSMRRLLTRLRPWPERSSGRLLRTPQRRACTTGMRCAATCCICMCEIQPCFYST